MAEAEFKTEHRISEIMKSLKMNSDDVRKVYYAFDKLVILKKHMPDSYRSKNQVTFSIGKEEYMERMKWINDFMRVHGMQEDVFTDVTSFEASSEDYDYYNEYKTPSQYKKDEEERKARKAKKPETPEAPSLDD